MARLLAAAVTATSIMGGLADADVGFTNADGGFAARQAADGTLRLWATGTRRARGPHAFKLRYRDLYEVDDSGAVVCSLGGVRFGSVQQGTLEMADGSSSYFMEVAQHADGSACGNVSLTVRHTLVTVARNASDLVPRDRHHSEGNETGEHAGAINDDDDDGGAAAPTPAASASASAPTPLARRRRLGEHSTRIFTPPGEAEGGEHGGSHGGERRGRRGRPHTPGPDVFLSVTVTISGWAWAGASNRLALDLKAVDSSPVGRPAFHLPRNLSSAGATNVPLESYALPFGANGDGSVTFGLLRLYTVALVDGAALLPVALARHGRVFQVVLPHHAHNVSWGGVLQSATVLDDATVGAAVGGGSDDAPNATDISLPPADVPVAAGGTNTGPLPGDGSVPAGTPEGGEATGASAPLPPVTGDAPEPDASSGAAAGAAPTSTLLALSAGAAMAVLQLAMRA